MNYQIRVRESGTKGDRFQVILEVWSEGTAKQIVGGTFDSEDEAKMMGAKLLVKHETNAQKRCAFTGELTYRDWAAEWLEGLDIKESSRNTYQYRFDTYILPTLGNYKLKDLNQLVINRWRLSLKSKKMQKLALSTVRSSLGAAIGLGMITEDPTAGIKMGGSKAKRNEEAEKSRVKVWDYLDAKKLLDASIGHKAEPLVVLGLYAGLRPGEVSALTWKDIDWLKGTVTVSKTRSYFRGKEYIGSTKTGKSRTVNLGYDAIQRLMKLQERTTGEAIYAYCSRTLNDHVASVCKEAGVVYLNPHCFRHTCASMLLSKGVPVAVVAEILGHETPETTMKVYWHCLPSDIDRAAGVLENALGTVPPPVPEEIPTVAEDPENQELASPEENA